MRFIAQRDKLTTLISVSGTNFIWRGREFKEYVAAWNKEKTEKNLNQQSIRWKFNQPAAPHFERVLEQLERSCKKTLYAVLRKRCITESVLSNIKGLVEQTFNDFRHEPIVP